MTNTEIRINDRKATIEITKTFAKNASIFGSTEYQNLHQAKLDNPNYRVVTIKSKSGDHMKGLDIDYMTNYIVAHPKMVSFVEEDEDGNENDVEMPILEALYQLCGKDEKGKKIEDATQASFGEIRAWFLEQYPEIKKTFNQKKNINAILKSKSKKAA